MLVRQQAMGSRTFVPAHEIPSYDRWLEPIRWPEAADHVPLVQDLWTRCRTVPPNDFPHWLVYGPPGTGKTSTVISYLRSLFGLYYGSMVLSLNASDDRGAQVLRQQLATFCQLLPSHGTPFPKRIVVLDEADSLTPEAQDVLCAAMDRFSGVRFFILCNFSAKIQPWLADRCLRVPFPSISKDCMLQILKTKCHFSALPQPPRDVLDKIIERGKGDVRACLQSLYGILWGIPTPESATESELTQVPEDAALDLRGWWESGASETSDTGGGGSTR